MGNQFAHVNTYSLKVNKGGASIESILGEASREADYCRHVEDPKPPIEILGSLKAVRDAANDIYENQKLKVNIKGVERERLVRKDRSVLMAGVLSFPKPIFVMSEEDWEFFAFWKQKNIDYLKTKYGQNLEAVIEHTDEEYPHMHFFVIADASVDFNAKLMHDGHKAKIEAEEKAKAEGVEPRTAVNLGNKAFRKAMSLWQDDYFEHVGAPSGLTRLGPKRQRLSRKEYQAQKRGARANSELVAERRARDEAEDRERARNLAQETKEAAFYLEGHQIKTKLVQKEIQALEEEKAALTQEIATKKSKAENLAKIAKLWESWENPEIPQEKRDEVRRQAEEALGLHGSSGRMMMGREARIIRNAARFIHAEPVIRAIRRCLDMGIKWVTEKIHSKNVYQRMKGFEEDRNPRAVEILADALEVLTDSEKQEAINKAVEDQIEFELEKIKPEPHPVVQAFIEATTSEQRASLSQDIDDLDLDDDDDFNVDSPEPR